MVPVPWASTEGSQCLGVLMMRVPLAGGGEVFPHFHIISGSDGVPETLF